MRKLLVLGFLLLTGCAHPGRVALMENSLQWNEVSSKEAGQVVSCVRDSVDNEPWSVSNVRAPVTRLDQAGAETRMVSISTGDVWLWELIVTPSSGGSHVAAAARYDAGGPYVRRTYMPDKIKTIIASCI